MREGIKAGVPLAVVGFLLAVSYGVLAQPVMGSGAPIVASALVFAGSAQFGALAVLAAGGGAGAAIAAAVMLNARYVPMGLALAPSLRGSWLRRALAGQPMTDATWAMAHQGEGRFDIGLLAWSTLPVYLAWVAGTAVGVLAGESIGDPERLGLDALFPAFFLALLVGESSGGRRAVAAAGLGVFVAMTLAPFTPAGAPIIVACAAALIGLRPDAREERNVT